MAFLEGFIGGLGQVASDSAHSMLESRMARYKGMADVYRTIASNPNVTPEVQQEAIRRMGLFQGVDPYNKDTINAVKGYEDMSDLWNAHDTAKNVNGTRGSQPTLAFQAAAKGSPAVASQPQPAAAPQPPQMQQQPQIAVPFHPMGGGQQQQQPVQAQAGGQSQLEPEKQQIIQELQSNPQMANNIHQQALQLVGEPPPIHGMYTREYKIWEESYTKAISDILETELLKRRLTMFKSGTNGGGLTSVFGETGAPKGSTLDRLIQDQWTKDYLTKRSPTRPTSGPAINNKPSVFFNGGHFDSVTGEPIQEGSVSKVPVTRTIETKKDPWGLGSSTTSTTSYGGGGGGKRTGTLVQSVPARVSGSLTPNETQPNANIPPEIASDPRFKAALDGLINRRMSLADIKDPSLRSYLVAAMPEDVRPAENPAELSKLISADKAVSLIQARIKEVRSAAAPDKNGKSILDSILNRLAIRTILTPPAGRDSSPTGPTNAARGMIGHMLEGTVQDVVRGAVDPKVLNYVNKLRQLRDDILALRNFLGNAPMRSNAQMNIQLSQVPDETISSYKDLDLLLSAFESTPTAAQGIQKGGRPSAPGSSSSVDHAHSGSSSQLTNVRKDGSTFWWSYDGGQTWDHGTSDPRLQP